MPRLKPLFALFLLLLLIACHPTATTTAPGCPIQVQVLARQTCEGLGACQGASIHDGFLYLYGDLYQKDHVSGPGVIRQYSFGPDDVGTPTSPTPAWK